MKVRQAFASLLNRQQLIERLFCGEYSAAHVGLSSDTMHENPNNPKNPHDPQQALKLLAAGWEGTATRRVG